MLLHKKKLLCCLLVILALSLGCEVFLFNFRFFLILLHHPRELVFRPGRITVQSGGTVKGGKIHMTGRRMTLTIPHVDTPLYNIKLDLANRCPAAFNAKIEYRDDNFSLTNINAGCWPVATKLPATQFFSVVSSGKCRQITVQLTGMRHGTPVIRSVEINRPFFKFSLLRFLLCLLLFSLLGLIHLTKPWAVPYRPETRAHKTVFIALLLAALTVSGIAFFGFANANHRDVVTKTVPASTKDDYLLLTQSFYNHRLGLMIKPPKALQTLSNPYDPSRRKAAHITYLGDTSYYNNTYYCYFGVAPVAVLLLPFRVVTGYYLSTDYACFLFYLIAVSLMALLYRRIVSLWYRDCNLLFFAAGELCMLMASGLLWMLIIPRFYELAILSYILFLFAGLNLILSALAGGKHTKLRLFFAGLCLALMVASRPNTVLYIPAALPLLWGLVKGKPKKEFSARLICFFAPLGAAALLIMLYNHLRFGSPFEFGARYQLTGSDIEFFSLTNISLLFYGFFHYFLQPIALKMQFPFFEIAKESARENTQFYFNQSTAGLVNFPVLWTLPACGYILRRMKPKTVKKAFLAVLLLCAFAVLCIDILLGGVTMRYAVDFIPVFLLCALMLWMQVHRYFKKRKADTPVTKVFAVLAVISVVFMTSICVFRSNVIPKQHLFLYLYDTFTFWN